jgi:hypothetical protein
MRFENDQRQSSGWYSNKCIHVRVDPGPPGTTVLDGYISSLDGNGATITWTTRNPGYYVYYLLVPAEDSYAQLHSTGAGTFNGFSRGYSGMIAFGHSYDDEGFGYADGSMYAQYNGGWFGAGGEPNNDLYAPWTQNDRQWMMSLGATGQGQQEADHFGPGQSDSLWGIIWSPWIANTVIGGATSNTQTATGRSGSLGSKGWNWTAADIDSYGVAWIAAPETLTSSTPYQIVCSDADFIITLNSPTKQAQSDRGWTYGLWAKEGDFKAVVHVSHSHSLSRAGTYSSRSYAYTSGMSVVDTSKYSAGHYVVAGDTITAVNDYAGGYVNSGALGFTDMLGVFAGITDDPQHLLPILGVGQ